MTIPNAILNNAEKILSSYCDKKIPLGIRDKLELVYSVTGNSIILYERRPHFLQNNKKHDSPVAKIKFINKWRNWELYYMNRNLRWCKYWDYVPKKRFSTILKEIDRDPTGIFWG